MTIGEMRDGYPEVYLAHETWMRAQRELERLRASRYSQKNLERAKLRAQVSARVVRGVFGSRVGVWFVRNAVLSTL